VKFLIGFVIGAGVGLAVGGRYALRAVAAKSAPDYDPYAKPFGEVVTIAEWIPGTTYVPDPPVNATN
jgi:hypothetical protein